VQAGSAGELVERLVARENRPRPHKKVPFDGAESVVLMPKAHSYRKVQIFFKKIKKN